MGTLARMHYLQRRGTPRTWKFWQRFMMSYPCLRIFFAVMHLKIIMFVIKSTNSSRNSDHSCSMERMVPVESAMRLVFRIVIYHHTSVKYIWATLFYRKGPQEKSQLL
jgi:hypothetical protein